MDDIHNDKGDVLGSVEIDPAHREKMRRGNPVNLHFHTPRLLSSVLPVHDFSFTLTEKNGNVVADDPDLAAKYLELQGQIATAVAPPPKEGDDQIAPLVVPPLGGAG